MAARRAVGSDPFRCELPGPSEKTPQNRFTARSLRLRQSPPAEPGGGIAVIGLRDTSNDDLANYLSQYEEEELARNGYEVIKGKRLKSMKAVLQEMYVPEINLGNVAKTPQLDLLT